LALIAVLIGHLVEEIKGGFRLKFPLGEMPRSVFVGINVVLYSFCFVTFILAVFDNRLGIPMAWVFAGAMLLNGVGHIAIMVVKRNYFPGGYTAFLLVPISVYLMTSLPNNG
jgi:hypothetical protein